MKIIFNKDLAQFQPLNDLSQRTTRYESRQRHPSPWKPQSLMDEVIKNADGSIAELRGSIDPATLGKNPEGRKVKGVIHWVSATNSIKAEVRLYERLFTELQPDNVEGHDFVELIVNGE